MIPSMKNKQTINILQKLKMPPSAGSGNRPGVSQVAPIDIFSGVESRPAEEAEDTELDGEEATDTQDDASLVSAHKPKTLLRKRRPLPQA